ncbi:hypothetical protein L249_1262 [Ophiocordyceps polyrhachis-furcata BCC 54312]|uniref:Uncharacterized protein n=1 Tax=Ophiocordyceps polyrhachis-furcata BCC 54312 TaxID=1330021 RepID=A0A367LCC2_9HYPO|nr:hypothetical protein L249_1262 [Ophiocordyceps polyrhachis-furcata BCC 54312]
MRWLEQKILERQALDILPALFPTNKELHFRPKRSLVSASHGGASTFECLSCYLVHNGSYGISHTPLVQGFDLSHGNSSTIVRNVYDVTLSMLTLDKNPDG